MRTKFLLGMGLLLATTPLFGQVRPAGFERTVPFKIGFGYSNFDSDWNGRVAGPALWADWTLSQAPGLLNHIAIEGQFRHLSEDNGRFHLRYKTFGGGALYNVDLRQHRWIRPYAGMLLGLGSVDFPPTKTGYSHDTRTIYAPTGGADFTLVSKVKLRASYDYEYWPDMFHHHALNPNGLTIGVTYDFGAKSSPTY